MSRAHRILLALLLLIPVSAIAARGPASFSLGRSLVAASSSPGNVYAAGVSVVDTALVEGDLTCVGGSIVTAATVRGDEMLAAGSVSSRSSVAGDLRAIGGGVTVEGPIGGDLIALGYSVLDAARTQGSTFIVAVDTEISNGATGPVVVYGNNISLAGEFSGNITIVATGRVSLAPDTVVRGTLTYEAPEEALIAPSATVLGGIKYTNASYLPDVGTSRLLSLISIGFFIIARILGALILAGLLAGLFPRLAEAVIVRAYEESPRHTLLTILLGFGILAATPVLIVLLGLTFVGLGLALLLFVAYAFLVLISLLYAGILLGGVFARRFAKRENVLWRDGLLGMLVLSLLWFVPIAGPFVVFLLMLFTAGTLLLLFFHFAFPHEEETLELL